MRNKKRKKKRKRKKKAQIKRNTQHCLKLTSFPFLENKPITS